MAYSSDSVVANLQHAAKLTRGGDQRNRSGSGSGSESDLGILCKEGKFGFGSGSKSLKTQRECHTSVTTTASFPAALTPPLHHSPSPSPMQKLSSHLLPPCSNSPATSSPHAATHQPPPPPMQQLTSHLLPPCPRSVPTYIPVPVNCPPRLLGSPPPLHLCVLTPPSHRCTTPRGGPCCTGC